MLKGNCLHPQLAKLLAETGHTDTLCVTDAGFPIPQGPQRIDLAWTPGNPGWLEVCELFRSQMYIQKIYLAEEIVEENPEQYHAFCRLFPDVPIAFVSHSELKEMSKKTRGVVRTGEFGSFCNCIFEAGVAF